MRRPNALLARHVPAKRGSSGEDPVRDGLAWLAGPIEEQAIKAVDDSAEDASF